MSAMIGNGEPFLISIIAWAASRVGTAIRTILQLASLRRAISLSVALTSRVSALVMDWATISAAPPMTPSPTRTGTDLRRALMASSQHIVICHEPDQSKQKSETNVVHDLLPGGVDGPAPNKLQYQKGGPATIERRERQDVGQAEAEAQQRHDTDDRQDSGLGGAGGGLDNTDRPLQAPGTEQTAEGLVCCQLVDACGDAGDRVAGLADREPTCLDRAGVPGPGRGVKSKNVATRIRIQLGGDGQRHQPRAPIDDLHHGSAFGGVERIGKVLELVDRMAVDRLDHVAGLQAGGVCRGS